MYPVADLDPPALHLRAVFDAIPLPTFVVDEDVRIQDFNAAAAELVGPDAQLALHHRGGDVLHCIHSESRGCGQGDHCPDCVIRNSVRKAICGQATHREKHHAELRKNGTIIPLELLITASPLAGTNPPTALLILEDVSEMMLLRGLLPICAHCHKIRDDQGYWTQIERYIHDRAGAEFTHSICPECARGKYPHLFPPTDQGR
jgi:PAS domain-containing protein